MQNFHEHKVWQSSYKSLMDLYTIVDEVDLEDNDTNEELLSELVEAAGDVAATIADALSRTDRKIGLGLIYDAVGLVAVTRTKLAVCWGRGLMDDTTFKSIDEPYAKLSEELQKMR